MQIVQTQMKLTNDEKWNDLSLKRISETQKAINDLHVILF